MTQQHSDVGGWRVGCQFRTSSGYIVHPCGLIFRADGGMGGPDLVVELGLLPHARAGVENLLLVVDLPSAGPISRVQLV